MMSVKKVILNNCRFLLMLIIFAMMVLNLVACISSAQENNINSGIKGIAVIGPVQPVSTPGEANEKPYPDAAIIIKSVPENKEIARVKAGSDGSFIIHLPAGSYVLEAINTSGSSLPFSKPVQVDVIADQYTEVTINFDSGIR